MNTPFTPGPWEAQSIDWDGPERGEAFIVGGNLGGLVGAALPWPSEVAEGPLYEFPRVAANARLIAAAPEMYEALNEIFNELDGRYDGAPDSRVLWMGEHITHIRAALAKAVQL